MIRYSCGIDQVEIKRIKNLVENSSAEALRSIFSSQEIKYSDSRGNRIGRLAARFAAKEACLKLFPKETASGSIELQDFAVQNCVYGSPIVVLSPRARSVADRYGFNDITISLSHTNTHAVAVAVASVRFVQSPLIGKLLFRLCGIRREQLLARLAQVYSRTLTHSEIELIAQSHCANLLHATIDSILFRFRQKSNGANCAEIRNAQSVNRSIAQGKGAIILAGSFANFIPLFASSLSEFAISRHCIYHLRLESPVSCWGRLLSPRHLDSGLQSLPLGSSIDCVIEHLQAGNVVVICEDVCLITSETTLDSRDRKSSEFLQTISLIASVSGSPIIPALSWRDEAGRNVLQFEEPLKLDERSDSVNRIQENGDLIVSIMEQMALRHPEDWYWCKRHSDL